MSRMKDKIKQNPWLLIGPVLIIAIAWWFWPEKVIRHPKGVLVAEAPYQGAATRTETWKVDDYSLTSMAQIKLKARVLSKAYYRFGREVALSQYDLALGWGPMSNQAVVDHYTISQSNRWYYWRYRHSPLSEPQIVQNSGNFHIVTFDPKILDTLDDIRTGHVVTLHGQLVHIKASDGWRWRSSTSRTDTGKGSCELVWVEKLSIEENVTPQ